jgi:hypothetical protein
MPVENIIELPTTIARPEAFNGYVPESMLDSVAEYYRWLEVMSFKRCASTDLPSLQVKYRPNCSNLDLDYDTSRRAPHPNYPFFHSLYAFTQEVATGQISDQVKIDQAGFKANMPKVNIGLVSLMRALMIIGQTNETPWREKRFYKHKQGSNYLHEKTTAIGRNEYAGAIFVPDNKDLIVSWRGLIDEPINDGLSALKASLTIKTRGYQGEDDNLRVSFNVYEKVKGTYQDLMRQLFQNSPTTLTTLASGSLYQCAELEKSIMRELGILDLYVSKKQFYDYVREVRGSSDTPLARDRRL